MAAGSNFGPDAPSPRVTAMRTSTWPRRTARRRRSANPACQGSHSSGICQRGSKYRWLPLLRVTVTDAPAPSRRACAKPVIEAGPKAGVALLTSGDALGFGRGVARLGGELAQALHQLAAALAVQLRLQFVQGQRHHVVVVQAAVFGIGGD